MGIATLIWKLKIKIQKGRRELLPKGGYMTISEVIEELMELAKRSNMTFDQLIEWLGKNNREENLPWEE